MKDLGESPHVAAINLALSLPVRTRRVSRSQHVGMVTGPASRFGESMLGLPEYGTPDRTQQGERRPTLQGVELRMRFELASRTPKLQLVHPNWGKARISS